MTRAVRSSSHQNDVELAKILLHRILSDPAVSDTGIPVKTIHAIGRDSGLVKGVLKEARRQMGIVSQDRDGVQFWLLPEVDIVPNSQRLGI